MDTLLSDRIQAIKPSATLAVSAKASALKAQGKAVINLGVGEPDFDTPINIKEAAKKAIDSGFTKYTAVEGILDLRKAVCEKFQRDNGLKYTPEQILVSNGGKQSFFNLTQALLNPGDEVIIPAPYWVSYPDIVSLADAKPVIIQAGIEQNYKIMPQQLEKAITAKTKCVVFNSPSNPSGMAYGREEWQALGAILRKHPQILIATDDMYEYIYWKKEPFSNILMCCPDLYDRTVVLHGVSKTYAMTGWRIGFAAGPRALIEGMTTLQSQSTSNPCSISQKAALAALTGDQLAVDIMGDAYKERHDYLTAALNLIPGIECPENDGTFYVFPRVQKLIDRLQSQNPKIKDDLSLAEYLLNECLVATVPGSAFGSPGYLRLSFATGLENLKEAVRRIEACVK